jgi:hypothetical protein
MGALGDYMRDEDFDSSYESLISLSAALGEVKPRATPEHIIASLDTGFYKDWVRADSDKRCPICLDDYKPLDPVLRLSDCSHWLHKECLEQWLRGAKTCPVCRKDVVGVCDHALNTDPGPSSRGGNRDREGDGGFSSAWSRVMGSPWRET